MQILQKARRPHEEWGKNATTTNECVHTAHKNNDGKRMNVYKNNKTPNSKQENNCFLGDAKMEISCT